MKNDLTVNQLKEAITTCEDDVRRRYSRSGTEG